MTKRENSIDRNKARDGRNIMDSKKRLADWRFDRALAEKTASLGLSKFESRAVCEERQRAMLQRFEAMSLPCGDWHALANCSVHHCAMCGGCVEACHIGTLNRRAAALDTGLPIMAAHPGPHWAVALVHPLWEARVGDLGDINIAAAVQWNRRGLADLKISGLLAIGVFEVSLNRERDGEVYWAGEIQQIVAGATKTELRRVFEIKGRHRRQRPHQRMVDVREFNDLNTRFAYSQKRLIEERRAYISAKTGRQDRRHLPPSPEPWAEFDAWLLGLPLGARTIAFGCPRRSTTFFVKK